jgi:NAD(P)-dependent dehydrogenase (short-subunit alcohol dehydrogenase family)
MPSALVVGASGSIGAACVQKLQEEDLAVFSARRSSFNRTGVKRPIRCDVTSQESVEGAVGIAAAWPGGIHVLVCAWGAPSLIKPSIELSPEEFNEIIQTDLVGCFRVCRQAGKYMVAQGYGRIVIVSSYHAIATYPMRAAYAAAKAGVVGLMQCLAIEWAQHGVTVNAVLPGQVESARSLKLGLPLDKIRQRFPTKKIPKPSDIADAVAFLCRRESGHINGHSIVIDGGWTKDAYWDHE